MHSRLLGWIWLLAWASLLGLLFHLWERLGLWVDDLLLWWAEALIGFAAICGALAGSVAREAARWGGGRSHRSLLRRYWLPLALPAMLLMVGFRLLGAHDEVRSVFGTFAGYWAGFDAGIGAWPLICGRGYHFARPMPAEDSDDEPQRDDGLDLFG